MATRFSEARVRVWGGAIWLEVPREIIEAIELLQHRHGKMPAVNLRRMKGRGKDRLTVWRNLLESPPT
jgi:hypothetical protein